MTGSPAPEGMAPVTLRPRMDSQREVGWRRDIYCSLLDVLGLCTCQTAPPLPAWTEAAVILLRSQLPTQPGAGGGAGPPWPSTATIRHPASLRSNDRLVHIRPPSCRPTSRGFTNQCGAKPCEVSGALHRALEAQGVNKHLETAGILNSSLKSILNQEG